MADLLPGLLTALAAIVLGLLLRRWYDPVPGRVWAVFGLLLVSLFGRVLFAGEVLLPLDNLRGYVPFRHLQPAEPHGNLLQGDLIQLIVPSLAAVRQSLEAGEWPLWNPRVGAGIPLLADPQAQAFQPLVLVTFILPLPQAAAATGALRVLLALVFTFLLLRRQGLGEAAALYGGVSFGLGGFVLLWLGWPLANAAVLLPVVLWSAVRCDQRGGRRDEIALAASLWCVLVAGHPEAILDVLALAVAFLAARLRARGPGRRVALLRSAGLAFVVAAAAAAPLLLPTLLYVPQTHRAALLRERLVVDRRPLEMESGEAAGRAPSAVARSVERLGAGQKLERLWLPVIAPNAFGNDRYVHYWGLTNINEDAAGFAGSGSALAALLALGLWRRRLPQERLMAFVLVGSLLAVASPAAVDAGWRWIEPFCRWSPHHHHRLLLLVGFTLAYLAACTLERLRRFSVGAEPSVVGAVGVVLAGVVLAAIVSWAYVAHPPPDPAMLRVFRYGWMIRQLRFICLAVLLLLVVAAFGRRWRGLSRTASFTLVAVTAVELLQVHAPANPAMPSRLAFPSSPPLELLKERCGGYRMAGLGRTLPANLASLYGLSDVRIYNPVEPHLYNRLRQPLTVDPTVNLPELGRPESALYDLLGVRFFLSPPEVPWPAPLRPVSRDPAGWIWERPDILRLLFLPATAEARSWDGWLEGLLSVEDFSGRALVMEAGGAHWRARLPEASRLELGPATRGRLRAEVRLVERRLLASSIFQDGGWRLLLDGARHPTVRANGPFLAAWLPAGDWTVDLVYRPPGFLAGCLLAACGLAAAWLRWLPPPRETSGFVKGGAR